MFSVTGSEWQRILQWQVTRADVDQRIRLWAELENQKLIGQYHNIVLVAQQIFGGENSSEGDVVSADDGLGSFTRQLKAAMKGK